MRDARTRVKKALEQGPGTATEIAERSGLSNREAAYHASTMARLGIIEGKPFNGGRSTIYNLK